MGGGERSSFGRWPTSTLHRQWEAPLLAMKWWLQLAVQTTNPVAVRLPRHSHATRTPRSIWWIWLRAATLANSSTSHHRSLLDIHRLPLLKSHPRPTTARTTLQTPKSSFNHLRQWSTASQACTIARSSPRSRMRDKIRVQPFLIGSPYIQKRRKALSLHSKGPRKLRKNSNHSKLRHVNPCLARCSKKSVSARVQ